MRDPLESLRRAEIEVVEPWFSPGMRVLEIGGGSGYQASVLAAWECDVVSLDLPNRAPYLRQYYPVQHYDGANIPFADESFDLVFSSNVLEHVRCLSSLLTEMHRVLKPTGLAVHILPSPAWRLWTSVSHYGYLLKYLLSYLLKAQLPKPGPVATAPSLHETLERRGPYHVAKRALFSGPHGEYSSALSELYYFSRKRWSRVFSESGFKIKQITETRLFYTGYLTFPNASLETRHRIAPLLGSAC